MKKFILILIASIRISFYLSAQTAGDYRSVESGNWNDPTKWETYNGSSWITASTYPGQNPGTGSVNILAFHEIKISASVPHPVASLSIQSFFDEYWSYEYYSGTLSFSAESAVSLTVSGNIDNSGTLNVIDQIGSKSHLLFIGGSLYGSLNAINGDDNLNVVFNSTFLNITVTGYGTFHDVTFNGNAFTTQGTMFISGVVAFIKGIVSTTGDSDYAPEFGLIHFEKGASWSGASNISYVDGWVSKVGDEPFTFPVGENGIYAPLIISAPVGSTEKYLAMYRRASGSDIGGITDPSLFNVSNCEYWNLTSRNGNGPLDVTVGWNSLNSCGASPYIMNVPAVTLAQFNESTWSSHGGVATGTSSNGSVTWRGATGFSASNNAYTFGNVSSCKTPSGLNSINVTGNSASVNWSPEPGAVSYDVYYANYPTAPMSYWTHGATATTSTSVNLSGLDQASKYYYRVRANCSDGSSSYRQSEFTTLTVCERPTGLTTTNITNVSATFNWQSVPEATGYLIELGRGYGSDWISINGVITSTSYTVFGLTSTYYTWRIRAICPEGYSHYQNSDIFWVYNSYCDQPSWLTTANITYNSTTLNWAPVTNASNYNVEYKQSTSAIWITAATGITSPSYTLNGLSASTGYDWRVLATCFTSVPGNYAQSFFTTTSLPACTDVYESNNASRQAKTIGLGATILAMISSNADMDWFKITTQNNSNTKLEVVLSNLPVDYDLYVYDKNLKLIGASTNTGISNEVVIYNLNARKATYYIQVAGKNGAYNTLQCYNLLAQVTSGASSASSKSYPANEVTDISDKQLLYPNPASEFVMLHFNSIEEGQVNVQIFNAAGQLVKQSIIRIAKGLNQVKIAVSDINQGMYFLRFNKGELNMLRKFVIAR